MNHSKHVNLIKKAITKKGGVWADLGSGEGAFTLALRDLAGADVEIYSIDKDKERMKQQQAAFDAQFPDTKIHYVPQNFTENLALPLLDGIIMANSLHYVQDHVAFLKKVYQNLKPSGKLVLVEYSIDEGNQWVPYPLSYPTFEIQATEAEFTKVKLLEKIPSSYWEEMYSAQAEKY